MNVDRLVTDTKIHRRIYTDPEIFSAEVENIFSRTWLFVAHEDEIPKVGDFCTLEVAGQPMLLCRASDGVHLFYNTCRHRGALVCREQQGNTRSFTCLYHNWTYDLRGKLRSRPHEEAYGPDFRKEELGLVEAPRLEIYNQMIFASLEPAVPALDEHLSDARFWIDAGYGREGGLRVLGYHRYSFRANWKLIVENTLDGYHGALLHRIMNRLAGGGATMYLKGRSGRLGHGHGLLAWDGKMSFNGKESELPPADAPLTDGVPLNRIVTLFPNLLVLDVNSAFNLRRILPVAVDETEVIAYALAPATDSDDERRTRVARFPVFWGPAGANGADDIEAFESCQKGFRARGVEWSDMSRGFDGHHDQMGNINDETAVRGFYRQWKQMMLGGGRGSENAREGRHVAANSPR